MRERLAKVLAALLTGLVVLMAAFFARQRNEIEVEVVVPPPAPRAEAVPPPPSDAAMVARGRAVFEAQSCERCHSVEGRGNPRSPLDGVGARLAPDALLEAVTGTGAAADDLSRSTVRAKEGFGRLPPGDLAPLVDYLSSLR
jgi:mono/diheme cytochrome c family protein